MPTGFVTDLLLVAPNADEPGTLVAAPALWGICSVWWCDGHAWEIAGNQIVHQDLGKGQSRREDLSLSPEPRGGGVWEISLLPLPAVPR